MMISGTHQSYVGMEFNLVAGCVLCSDCDINSITRAVDRVWAKATHVTYYGLDDENLVVEIHATMNDNSTISLELYPEAFDFLTHLVNGSLLRFVHPDQPDIVVCGVDEVLAAWRGRLLSEGFKPNPLSRWFDGVLWHLGEPDSLVVRYSVDEDLYYLGSAEES